MSLPPDFVDAVSAPEIGVTGVTAGTRAEDGLTARAPPFPEDISSPPFFLIAPGFTFFFLPVIKLFALSLAALFTMLPPTVFAAPAKSPNISRHRQTKNFNLLLRDHRICINFW